MKFTIEIGEKEKKTISYRFNKFWGYVTIKVDDQKVKKDIRTYWLNHSNYYEFELGNNEKHLVKIEKIRPLVMAGFKSNTYRVFMAPSL